MIVVADTSVLVNLCRIQQADLLLALFQDVVIPPEVADEFIRLTRTNARFASLILPEGIRQQKVKSLPHLLKSAPGLDAGETAALALAVEIRADAVLVDEQAGRDTAIQLGLPVIGILGILLRAKSIGQIEK